MNIFSFHFFTRRNSEQHLSLRNSDRQTYEDLNEYEIHTDYSSSASQQSISPKKELVS